MKQRCLQVLLAVHIVSAVECQWGAGQPADLPDRTCSNCRTGIMQASRPVDFMTAKYTAQGTPAAATQMAGRGWQH